MLGRGECYITKLGIACSHEFWLPKTMACHELRGGFRGGTVIRLKKGVRAHRAIFQCASDHSLTIRKVGNQALKVRFLILEVRSGSANQEEN